MYKEILSLAKKERSTRENVLKTQLTRDEIAEVAENGTNTTVSLERIGRMPMPLDILVEYEDGSKEAYYIPNTLMRWEKENQSPEINRTVLNGWDWSNPIFKFTIAKQKNTIKKISIDPSGLMADIDQKNNVFEKK